MSPVAPVLWTVAWHAVLLLLLAGFLFFQAPRLQLVFADFDAALPPLTQHFFGALGFLRHHTLLVLFLLAAALALDAGACAVAQAVGGNGLRRCWSAVVLVGLGAVITVTIIALYLPLIKADYFVP